MSRQPKCYSIRCSCKGVNLRGYNPRTVPNKLQLDKLIRAIDAAERPIIIAGGGVIYSGAHEEMYEFVKRTEIPITTTLLGLGCFPSADELWMGMPGMHGTYTANNAIQQCDLLINIGARFDDRVTGKLDGFAPKAKIVHIDIDPAEIGKNVSPDIPIVGDVKTVLEMLIPDVRRQQVPMPGEHKLPSGSWISRCATRIRRLSLNRNGLLK